MKRLTNFSFILLFGFLVFFNVACSDSEHGNNSNDSMILDQLMTSAEKARHKASELGFEWNTIQPLMDKGREAMSKGDEGLAYDYFNEAKAHSELAIAQAKYADENWQLLIPVIQQ